MIVFPAEDLWIVDEPSLFIKVLAVEHIDHELRDLRVDQEQQDDQRRDEPSIQDVDPTAVQLGDLPLMLQDYVPDCDRTDAAEYRQGSIQY